MLGFFYLPKKDRPLAKAIRHIVGYSPTNIALYQLATQHVSVAKINSQGVKESNERLEYLGDAILSAVVADYLFKKFPFKDEGFLTEIRSRIVNRESLNTVARKIGLIDLIRYERVQGKLREPLPVSTNDPPVKKPKKQRAKLTHKSIGGNTLEALVGAVYLDKGFRTCRRFILKKLLIPHFDLSTVVETNTNYKSKVIEWAQKHNRDIRFEIIDVRGDHQYKEFIAQLFVDDQPVSQGSGYSKKKAEQRASETALPQLIQA